MMFNYRSFPGLFYWADNQKQVAGHVRLFTGQYGRGWVFYTYNQMLPHWALTRAWNFGLFCVKHVGPGDSTKPAGWSVSWAGFRKCRCGHWGWKWADRWS